MPMFTGIVEGLGRVRSVQALGGDRRIVIDAGALDLRGVHAGDSICVSGVCLTALDPDAHGFAADLSSETLARTTLGRLAVGDAVNLERSLTPATPLGGHFVTGHVDGVGQVVSVTPDGRAERWVFAVPAELTPYIAPKGSIAVDGVSLTVNEVADARFGVVLIPHTRARTTFGTRRVGDPVNIEVDLIARYVERLLATRG
jgi:riboflavin synthase